MKQIARISLLFVLCQVIIACGRPPGQPAQATPLAATPTHTLLPSATSTPPPTSTPTATPVPSGRCDNPLMSLDVGNRWKYHATSSLGSSDYSLGVLAWDESVGLNAVIEMANLHTGVVDNDLVTCLEGGGIEDFPLFFVSMQLGDYLDGVLNTYYYSGIYAPPYQELFSSSWLLGWEAEYWTEEPACFTRVMNDGSLCIGRSSSIELKFYTEGQNESVTVPAGTFANAMQVKFSLRMATTIVLPGMNTSAPLTVETTQWYEPFLGLVRSEITTSYVELLPGQNSTAPFSSVIELVEYTVQP